MKVIKKSRTVKKIVWRYLREKCLGQTEELDNYIKLIDDLSKEPTRELIDEIKSEMNIINEYRKEGKLSESTSNELYVATNIFIQKAIRELTPPAERSTKWEDFESIAEEYNAFKVEGFSEIFDKLTKKLKTKSNKKYDITEEEYEELRNNIEKVEDRLFDIDLYLYYRSKQEFDGALRVFKNRIQKSTKTEVGEKIKEIRESKGFSLIDISLSTGFSVSYIYRIEQGERNVSISVALKIADALGVAVNTFYNTEELDIINKQRMLELEEIVSLYDYKLNGKKAKKTEKQLLLNMLRELVKLKRSNANKKIERLSDFDENDLKTLEEAVVNFLNK